MRLEMIPLGKHTLGQIIALTAACGWGAALGCSAADVSGPVPGTVIVEAPAVASLHPADPLTVDSAAIVNNRLRVHVTYGGGCAEHELSAIAERAWLESIPVQLLIHIAHDARGDPCDALVARTLDFNLHQVRAAFQQDYGRSHGEVDLVLSALSNPSVRAAVVRYTF